MRVKGIIRRDKVVTQLLSFFINGNDDSFTHPRFGIEMRNNYIIGIRLG